MPQSKYPELAHAESWTPRMLYIHRRAMIVGLILGACLGGLTTGAIEVVRAML